MSRLGRLGDFSVPGEHLPGDQDGFHVRQFLDFQPAARQLDYLPGDHHEFHVPPRFCVQPTPQQLESLPGDHHGFHVRRAKCFNQLVGNWKASKVTTMRSTFSFAEAFNQPLGNWDVSQMMWPYAGRERHIKHRCLERLKTNKIPKGKIGDKPEQRILNTENIGDKASSCLDRKPQQKLCFFLANIGPLWVWGCASTNPSLSNMGSMVVTWKAVQLPSG